MILRTPHRAALAAVAGLGVAAGFAPVDQPVLLLLGLAAFVVALRGASVRAGLLHGAVFGLTFMGFLVWWVHVLGVGVWVALVALETPFYAAFGAGFAVLQHRRAWPLWTAMLWVGTEYARSVVPLGGFAWGRIGLVAVGTPLESYARWVGIATLGGLVFLAVALLVAAAVRLRQVGRLDRLVALPVAGALAVLLGGVVLPVGAAGANGSTRYAIVQGGVPGTGADGLGQQREVLANHLEATRQLAADVADGTRPQPDAVLWPENASDIDPFTDPASGRQISQVAAEVGVPLLVGAILDGPTPETAENVGIVWDPRTGPGQEYVKRHLVPYGEYVPLRGLVEKVVPFVTEEIPRDMQSGDEPGVLQLGGTLVGDMMCYDVAFDPIARDVVEGGAEVLVVQTSNATYTGTAQPEQQWQIARMRAVEAGRAVAVPSLNGISGAIGPDGEVLAKSGTDGAETLDVTVPTADGVTWGIRLGGWLELAWSALGVLVLAGSVLARRRTPEPAPAVRA